MAVRCDGERVRKGIAFLDEDLVPDSAAGGVEVDAVLAGEHLDACVLSEVLLRLVLDVVVEGEHRLRRAVYALCADGLEPGARTLLLRAHVWSLEERDALGYDGACVVVGHDMFRADHDIVARFDELALGQAHGVLLDDLLDDRLRDPRALGRGRKMPVRVVASPWSG